MPPVAVLPPGRSGVTPLPGRGTRYQTTGEARDTRSDRYASRAEDAGYSMGAAADLLGVQPAFLRALGRGGLLQSNCPVAGTAATPATTWTWRPAPGRSLTRGMTLGAAACRIVALEHQLRQAQAAIALLQRGLDPPPKPVMVNQRHRSGAACGTAVAGDPACPC